MDSSASLSFSLTILELSQLKWLRLLKQLSKVSLRHSQCLFLEVEAAQQLLNKLKSRLYNRVAQGNQYNFSSNSYMEALPWHPTEEGALQCLSWITFTHRSPLYRSFLTWRLRTTLDSQWMKIPQWLRWLSPWSRSTDLSSPNQVPTYQVRKQIFLAWRYPLPLLLQETGKWESMLPNHWVWAG